MIGDSSPGLEELRQLRFTTRVINEAMRLYPQPPVLIRYPATTSGCGYAAQDTGSC